MAASASPSIRRVRIWSMASSSLILLMAKPTWISTQSPFTGKLSCKSPKSTLRRTPTTSISAAVGWSGKSSTTCPGMAKHMALLFLSRQNVKRKFQFIFHFQRASGDGRQFQIVIGLQKGEGSKCPQEILGERDSRRDSLRASHAVQGQVASERD